jgi:membrane protease YdiL (CAAX protease family)
VDGIQVVTLVYTGLLIVLFIAMVVSYFRHRRRVRRYTRLAVILALGVVAIDAGIFILNPDVRVALGAPMVFCLNVVVFARLVIYGVVGMYCARSVDVPHAAVLRAMSARRPPRVAGLARGMLLWVPAIVAGAVAFSWVLFTLVPTRMSDAMRELLESSVSNAPVSTEPSLVAALVMLEFALAEEITFRLGIQNFLARVFGLGGSRYWLAILCSTVLWSAAHAGMLEPDRVKFVQVAPLGIALGCLARRYGVESSIVAHAAFNLIMMFLAPGLIEF